MVETPAENQIESGNQEPVGHILVAGWTDENKILDCVEKKLSVYGHTHTVINNAPIPHIILDQAVEEEAKALVCLMQTVTDRRNVYRLMALCRRQQFYIPFILLGQAADPQFAQILALPENGNLYPGGVYYCEDADEMIQVLKHVILYTPPPVQHDHDHTDTYSCSDCSSCADSCTLNQGW
jgi:hypothetical protein